jgi:formate hydrogenlyase subunit 3/multisubunit Na+/H+ antiporter MnhD subunit
MPAPSVLDTQQSAAPSSPDEIAELTSLSAELRRMDFSGGLWFAASIVAAGIPLAGLFANGWRPTDLANPEAGIWWFGCLLTVLSLAAFGWGGCPSYAFAPDVALRQKTYCMRAGVVLFIAGGVLSSLTVLVSPTT